MASQVGSDAGCSNAQACAWSGCLKEVSQRQSPWHNPSTDTEATAEQSHHARQQRSDSKVQHPRIAHKAEVCFSTAIALGTAGGSQTGNACISDTCRPGAGQVRTTIAPGGIPSARGRNAARRNDCLAVVAHHLIALGCCIGIITCLHDRSCRHEYYGCL